MFFFYCFCFFHCVILSLCHSVISLHFFPSHFILHFGFYFFFPLSFYVVNHVKRTTGLPGVRVGAEPEGGARARAGAEDELVTESLQATRRDDNTHKTGHDRSDEGPRKRFQMTRKRAEANTVVMSYNEKITPQQTDPTPPGS